MHTGGGGGGERGDVEIKVYPPSKIFAKLNTKKVYPPKKFCKNLMDPPPGFPNHVHLWVGVIAMTCHMQNFRIFDNL